MTGGIGPGVTSSLYQTVFDQDFSLQTANPTFDLTIGLFSSGSIVATSRQGIDSTGKAIFPSSSMMMREKTDIYKQFAQTLLGNGMTQFTAPYDAVLATDRIDAAMFVCFKRLFARDKIKRETFAMRFLTSGSHGGPNRVNVQTMLTGSELVNASAIYTDIGSSNNKNYAFGGEVGNIVNATNTSQSVGLMFYDRGVAVFDLAKIITSNQRVSGVISAMQSAFTNGTFPGSTIIGPQQPLSENPNATFIPDFIVSGSIDNIVDHLGGVRFGGAAQTAITFQNVTNINSTLIFCRAASDEFNYSSNPTFTDTNNRIVVIDPGQEDTQSTFTFITGVGLYDANDNLLATAKVSRPIEKSFERDLTIRLRTDF